MSKWFWRFISIMTGFNALYLAMKFWAGRPVDDLLDQVCIVMAVLYVAADLWPAKWRSPERKAGE